MTGIGIVFVALGRRILDAKPGVFPATHKLFSLSPLKQKQKKLLFFYLEVTVRTNEYRLNWQTCPGILSIPTITTGFVGLGFWSLGSQLARWFSPAPAQACPWHFFSLPLLRMARQWLSLTIYFSPLRLALHFVSFFYGTCRPRYNDVQTCGSGF